MNPTVPVRVIDMNTVSAIQPSWGCVQTVLQR
jgi:hypothetical protein